MPQKQNPTTSGRALWNNLAVASTDVPSLHELRAQFLTGVHGIHPARARVMAPLLFGGEGHHD